MPRETAGSSIASAVIMDCICSVSQRPRQRVFKNRSSAADAERAARSIRRIGKTAASVDVAFQIAIGSGKLPARSNKDSSSVNFCEPTEPLRSMPSRVVPRRLTTSKDRSRNRFSFTSQTISLPTRRIQRERRYSAKSIAEIDDASQSFTVLSPEPEARVFPSGLHATLRTKSVCPCKVFSSLPVAASQSFTVLSPEPEARVFPSGLHATLQTALECPCKVFSNLPVAASQSFTVWSTEPEARVFPSGLHATLEKIPPVFSSLPVAASQSFTVLSIEPEARVFPSGLHATLQTSPERPCKVFSSSPVAASQSFTVWSTEPEARVFPSGLHATPQTSPECPCKVFSRLPVAASQSFTVWSLEPEA